MKTSKRCPRCEETKDIDDFYRCKKRVNSHCKECQKEVTKNWQQNNPEQVALRKREGNLKRLYGITLEQYNLLLNKQKECCAICEKHYSKFTRRLSVDHNHQTGEVRGLLCTYCNHRLIGRHKDPSLLRKMADYVEQGTGWFVPKKERPNKRKKK
jgi:hypothetical protein